MNIHEKIFRIWSSKQEDQIAIRICYSIEQEGTCKIYNILEREEWQ